MEPNTSTPNLDRALRLCKGTFQRALVNGTESLCGTTLRGNAKIYASKYRLSALALRHRLEENCILYEILPGPRGGYSSARLHIIEDTPLSNQKGT